MITLALQDMLFCSRGKILEESGRDSPDGMALEIRRQ